MKYKQIIRQILPFLLFGMIVFGHPENGFSQCDPDLVGCVDIDEPGQMCPSVLPDGFVGEYYEQIITVLTPESGNVGSLNINIHKLKLKSVENLPEGLQYHSETNEFFANEAYCLTLDGTPLQTGVYKLKITVIPYIRVVGIPVPWGEFVDSTSVVMTIGTSTLIDPMESLDFSLINAYPNPFLSTTRIGFYESGSEQVELRLYNTLGREMYYEKRQSKIGENYFDFTGNNLAPGYYIYAIVRKNKVLNGRLIKNR